MYLQDAMEDFDAVNYLEKYHTESQTKEKKKKTKHHHAKNKRSGPIAPTSARKEKKKKTKAKTC